MGRCFWASTLSSVEVHWGSVSTFEANVEAQAAHGKGRLPGSICESGCVCPQTSRFAGRAHALEHYSRSLGSYVPNRANRRQDILVGPNSFHQRWIHDTLGAHNGKSPPI